MCTYELQPKKRCARDSCRAGRVGAFRGNSRPFLRKLKGVVVVFRDTGRPF